MICPNCENNKFEENRVRIDQEFKGQSFTVVVPALVCKKCGFNQFNDSQANNLRKTVIDKYRDQHNLLTSGEIKDFRSSLKMSQAQFSEYLGVGVASIKRWETYFIQEKSQDDLIRIKCDHFSAEKNALEISWAQDKEDIYNGFKKFDIEAFKNLMVKFIRIGRSPLFVFKILFFVDFFHFKRFKKSISGMKYSGMQFGPIPVKYDVLIEYVINEGWFERKGKHDLKPLIEFDENYFSTDEIIIINQIYELAEKKGKKYFLDKSHEEDAYKLCDYLGVLSYEYAKNINIKTV